MIDHRVIQDLIPILRQHGVKTIKTQGFELEFHVEQGQTIPFKGPLPVNVSLHSHTEHQPEDSTKLIADTIRKQEEALPPDLRADSLMDQDKILNWSSPDQNPEEPELPLTGEQPL